MLDPIRSGSATDRAGRRAPARRRDRARPGIATAALRPPGQRFRAALDSANLADRIDRVWILPAHDHEHRSCA